MIRRALVLALAAAGFAGCRAEQAGNVEAERPAARAAATPEVARVQPAKVAPAPEVAVELIPLAGDAALDIAELSGLAWFGDQLVLLPQYPDRFESAHQGVLFAIARAELEARIEHTSEQPIEPARIELVAPGLFERIDGFEGFESIAFAGTRAYLTIEASGSGGMAGYLVRGDMDAGGTRLVIDTHTLADIPAATDLDNASDESVLVLGDRVLTLYEGNGAGVNPAPHAHVFDASLGALGTIPFPSIEYRVTDASDADAQQRFWVINYLFSGDRTKYRPAEDAIAARYGRGETHGRSESVERLLELQYTPAGITLVERPPIALRLQPGDRNWEGLVRWSERGFLVVTDRFPETMLGYVPRPR